MTSTTLASCKVSPFALAVLTDKIDKLNRRADRHGMNRLVLTVVSVTTEFNEDKGCDEEWNHVEITGSAPRINGWALAAKIERDDIVGTLVSVVPGDHADDDYSAYREHNFGCDHCGHIRNRAAVFVLKHSDGSTKVVGRNCLADFVRSGDAEDFARYAEFVDQLQSLDSADLDEEWGRENYGGRYGYPELSLETFLPLVTAVTRRVGWVSRTAAKDIDGGVATADWTLRILQSNDRHIRKFVEYNEIAVNDGDRDLAGKAVQWAQSLQSDQTDRSEYLHVIHTIAVTGRVNNRLAGYAASIVRAYQNDCERRAEREEKAKNAPRKVYAGDPGKTRDIGVVTIKRVRYIDGYYGTRTIVAMELPVGDDAVAPITWFGSGSLEFEEGERFHLRAGIKECSDDPKWGKQTIVTRAKLTPVE